MPSAFIFFSSVGDGQNCCLSVSCHSAVLDTLSCLIWTLHMQNPCLSAIHSKNKFIFSKLIITACYWIISVRNNPARALSLSLSLSFFFFKDVMWLLWFLQRMWVSQLLWRFCGALSDLNTWENFIHYFPGETVYGLECTVGISKSYL
jgi:hypothetical protein